MYQSKSNSFDFVLKYWHPVCRHCITCKVKLFIASLKYACSNVLLKLHVIVLDFLGPTITTNPEIPFRSGSNVVFTCMVETLSTQITFEWECLGKVEPISRRVSMFNSTKYYSDIMRNVHVVHDGKTCRCSINVDGILGSFDISLAISSKYISINKSINCTKFKKKWNVLFIVIYTIYSAIDNGYNDNSRILIENRSSTFTITTKSNEIAILKDTITKLLVFPIMISLIEKKHT